MEDLQKQNTDCVYFLASPLTCKKGIECEYRHSDTARLNPRDCWYWLAGNCSNPTCGFRHPPLDVHSEVSSESVAGPVHQFSIPMNKTDVPCYFYFSGFCNRGDRCCFSHGHDDSTPALKPFKATSSVPDSLSLDNKTSAGSETKSVPIKTAPQAPLPLLIQPNEVFQKPVSNKVWKPSASPQMPASRCVEAAALRSEPLFPEEGFVQSSSPVCTVQSSDEEVDDHTEPEERWESSPGFDVLVDGRSDTIDYEDGPDYTVALDREERELNTLFLGYDFEDQVEYNPKHPEAENLYEHGRYDSYDYLDYSHHDSDYGQMVHRFSRERMLDPTLSRKRKLLPMEFAGNGQICVDLREHLRKRREMDHSSANYFSRRHDKSHMISGTGERSRRHRRLTSEVGRKIIGSFGENVPLLNGVNRQIRSRQRVLHRSRQRFEAKRPNGKHLLPSKVSRKPATTERRFTESGSFTGPKTLAEIREEKRKVQDNGGRFGLFEDSSRITSGDFQGPKPLGEILKEKEEG